MQKTNRRNVNIVTGGIATKRSASEVRKSVTTFFLRRKRILKRNRRVMAVHMGELLLVWASVCKTDEKEREVREMKWLRNEVYPP